MKGIVHMVKSSNDTKNPLHIVSHAKGFHFYMAIGDYCGVSVYSLEEFSEALQHVCSEAILFHFERGDFQNWIRDVIGDNELAQKIDDLQMCDRHLAAESCRREIVERVRARIIQLESSRMVSGNKDFNISH